MAQLLDQSSLPSSKSEIDLFSVPTTQVAVERGFWSDVHPVNTLTSNGPFEFHISPDPHYLDLNKNYIYMQLKITQGDGTDLQAGANADQVGPIHLIGKTFFKQVKLFLNNKLAYDSGDTYAYRAHLETLFNFDEGVKSTFLNAAGYKVDAPTDHLDDNQNTGWAARVAWFAQSAVVEFMAPLHVDLFHQEKYLLNNIDVRLELHRNTEAFALMCFAANPTYKVEVQNMRWVVRKVDLLSSISLALESTLLRTTAKYPIRRVQIKTVQLSAGRRDTPTNTVFNGQIPRRLVVGCVDNDAFHGNWQKTPFNFKNYNAASIQVTAGGVNYPPNPLTMNYGTNNYIRPFVQLYEALGLAGTDKSCWVDLNDFANGNSLYVFDLSPDTGDGGHWELVREGATTIQMTFRNVIPAGGVKMIVFAEFDNLVTVDRFRNVYFDYTP